MVSSSIGKMAQGDPNSGDMLAMVARSARGRPERPSPKNSTNLSTTPFLRRISVTVSTRSVAVVPAGRSPVSLKPITCGISIVTGWAQQGGLGRDSAHAPTQHPQPVDHGGVRIGPDQGIGIGELPARGIVGENHPCQAFEVDLMNDPGVGRHDLEIAERRLSPAQEHVAFAVAVELDFIVVL